MSVAGTEGSKSVQSLMLGDGKEAMMVESAINSIKSVSTCIESHFKNTQFYYSLLLNSILSSVDAIICRGIFKDFECMYFTQKLVKLL